MRRLCATLLLAGLVVWTGCSDDPSPTSPGPELALKATTQGNGGKTEFTMDPALRAEIESRLTETVRGLQAQLEEQRTEIGTDEGVATAPLGYFWIGHLEGRTMGAQVVFEDRGNKQIAPQWVPGDPRRGGRADVGYAVLPPGFPGIAPAPPGLAATDVNAAIDRAMATWEAQTCSDGLSVPKGTFPEWQRLESDILHVGFLPLGEGVIGVTIPSVFVDPATGEPTDIDSDGHPDYASAQIAYNSDFAWAIDGNIDVETVVLHEAGHGLGQGHFGMAFITPANGKVHFAPRAVMNAAYSGPQQSLTGTDEAGHCSMYGSWPNH